MFRTAQGPSQVLLDHPVVAGVLNEILSNQGRADENTYGFRFDHTGLQHRMADKDGSRGAEANQWNPHGGGGLFNFPGNVRDITHYPMTSVPMNSAAKSPDCDLILCLMVYNVNSRTNIIW